MNKDIFVVKRDGTKELFDAEKINQVVEWSCEKLENVSVMDIVLHANLKIYNGILTTQIHKVIIDSASDLISEEFPNYQYVAGKLVNFNLRKNVWGSHKPISLYKLIKTNIEKGIYTPEILNWYTKEEIDHFDSKIQHDRDYDFTFAGIQQLVDKYLVQDRSTKEVFETPQFAFMLIGMVAFHKYSKDKRDKQIIKFYNQVSTMKISLPTPVMAGVRTNIKQFASCVLIDVDDDLKSIFSSVSAVGYYTARRAGIGVNMGRLRPIGSPIRGGEVISTGVIPYLKIFEATVKSTQQSGIRGGGATVHVPIFHYEIEEILTLKNNAGTDDTRVRKLDYSIQMSKLFYKRIIENKDITLLSPAECKGLYESFGQPEFDATYEKYEQDDSLIFKKKINARELFNSLLKEGLETGRYYIMNIDTANEHSSWCKPLYTSNLCQEILQPTKPLKHIDDPDAEIGVCILSSINLLTVKDNEIESVAETIVRFLDEVIDYQDYPIKAAENFTKKRRSLGIGITNLAAFLAKNKISYEDPEAINLVDEKMEAIQYNLLLASSKLAEEKGKCEGYEDTKYSKGWLPIDKKIPALEALITRTRTMPWEEVLRPRIAKTGLAHSTLSCLMPVESSSVIQNTTNGGEPVRAILTVKKSKVNGLKQLVPNPHLAKYYTLAFDMKDNTGIINVGATIQYWLDMGSSFNLYYDYSKFPNKQIPISVLAKEQIDLYKKGMKTRYYINSKDGDKQESSQEEKCAGGACAL